MNWLKQLNPGNSLRAQISFASGALALVLSLVLSFLAAENSKQQIEKREGEAFASRARNALDVMDRGMFERSREIRNAATLDDIRNPHVPIERKRNILERLQHNFNAYAWIGICNTQGKGIVGTGKYLEGKDLSKRPWCTKGREGDYFGDVHDALLLAKLLPNPSGQTFYLVDVAAPVIDAEGVLQGVLCGHIYWNWAEEALDSTRTPGKDILLVSRDGLVLSGPEQPRSELSSLAPLTMQAIRQGGNDSGYLLEKWSNGKTYLVGYAKSSGYRDYPGLGWASLVRQDVSQAFAPAHQLRQRILMMGVALGLLFAWLGWLLAEHIARPIVRISRAANKVATGDLAYDVPEQQGGDEVAQLSRAIHAMVSNLTREIRQRRKAEESMRLSAAVFANNTEAIMITDADHNIVMINRAFTEINGYTEAEVLGKNPRLLASGKQGKEFYRDFYAALHNKDAWRGEIWNKRKNGEIFPEWVTVSVIRDQQAAITHYIAIYMDITERKKEEERIQYLANYDVLTGLPNRYLLNDRLEQGLSLAQRHQTKVAVMFIDLDHFKNINDSLGHDVGDALLKMVSQRLKGCLRRSDTIARQGGDEFVALLGDLNSEDEVTFVCEKMLHSLREEFEVAEYHLSVGTSIGVSIYPDDGETSVQLLRNADLAMYRAKDAGRNRFEYYKPEMNTKALQRLHLENALRSAIAENQLMVYCQPKVNVNSGAVVGLEALLRWKHPQLGFVSPAEFIPVAEESGLINEIGDWVLRQTALQQRLWQSHGYAIVPIAVNLSARQCGQKDLVEKIQTIVRDTGLPPQFIEFELTESMLMDMGVNCLELMNKLSSAGFSLALDDFGTGYSSLSRLKLLPVKTLKIDQSFVRDIATDENDEIIVNATAVLAHAMEMKVVAEGVETQQQLEFIRDLQCEEYQGYLFSRPVPPDEAEQFLRQD
ncbi:bifunctional diguanylate cyclase/phosphodiesterase [Sideroxydans lithotrophicus]|uniref:Diguanylate cyclase/phosphodiesterase with PAS/PAC sensor(S) n=1 Tax=Sideroxydans lithotrophicus (strain ES-1) TaxID=580332 RepID=D5CN61_SIDLE|nr:EAL domain-containing protein [Sideroxydans lithotrophicus]ADE12758.1 diguanylate cyclase/phosphodiesterase with PAS/PAC sensor(s) [Sideroxydans lithotrophicus ES-1]